MYAMMAVRGYPPPSGKAYMGERQSRVFLVDASDFHGWMTKAGGGTCHSWNTCMNCCKARTPLHTIPTHHFPPHNPWPWHLLHADRPQLLDQLDLRRVKAACPNLSGERGWKCGQWTHLLRNQHQSMPEGPSRLQVHASV